MKQILLDGQTISLTKDNLPMLIQGADGNGASLFSVSVIANLYAQGAKLLFLCGYHMARDEFIEQTGAEADTILVQGSDDFEHAATSGLYLWLVRMPSCSSS